MLAAAVLVAAAACGPWHGAAVGAYPGVVMSNGMKRIDTWIEQAPDGRLQGRYVLHEPGREVEGTLAPVADEGCETALFQWTDLYGTGLARLTFDTEHHCFDGNWGQVAVLDTLVWHACFHPRLTS